MNSRPIFLILLFLCVMWMPSSFAGVIYHDFESGNGLALNVWPVGSAGVGVVGRTEAVYSGLSSLKISSTGNWTGFGIQSRSTGVLNIKETNNDRLTFWIYALPTRLCYIYGCTNGTDNTVGVKLFDNNVYKLNGYEVWTTQTARYSQWSKLKILFSQLPPDFDLTQVTKVEFKNYNPGNYYFDDIQAVREDRVYQSFEKQERSGSLDSEYGWKWNTEDSAAISIDGEPVYEGSHSWKLVSINKWSGTGIQSQEKKYLNINNSAGQTFWNVDLLPEINDRLTFRVYGLPSNGMDNNISIQFYDNGTHSTDQTKVVFWPKKGIVNGKWTRVTVLFSDLKKIFTDQGLVFDLNLKDINKIQFQNYWPGTFYIDDIRASGGIPVIQQVAATGKVQWNAINAAAIYRLQESVTGEPGTWKTIYTGSATSFILDHISRNFLRVRWEEAAVNSTTVPYVSPWSDTFEFLPPAVVLSYANLNAGKLIWSSIPQAVVYEVQSAASKFGSWTPVYRGVKINTLLATLGKWYRVRAVQTVNNQVTGLTPWSRPQLYKPNTGFVKAAGTVIKDGDGAGDTLVLNGVNLGGFLVNEPWMTGIGSADSPALDDDWSVRAQLTARFGEVSANTLLKKYQDSYLTTYDFDSLVQQGITMVRLPFYYRNLQDDNGNWIRNAAGQIDFSPLDRIVNACADRGIYVVLDLHGAPGLQSADATTGRKGVNALFAATGETYRLRTIDMWTEIARHYKTNRWVLGYDLLNEPIGVNSNISLLANVYDRIYKAIRLVDSNHLIIMEGVWPIDPQAVNQFVDWDTLPKPSTIISGVKDSVWINVMYQFHFYHWDYTDANGNKVKADEDFASHKAFIDGKIAKANLIQPQYNVPVMIGEFYGFGLSSIWNYYVQAFNARKWSWSSWSYKYQGSPQNWGLFNNTYYTDALPAIRKDSYNTLLSKLSKYTTHYYHAANVTLQKLVTDSCRSLRLFPVSKPFVSDLSVLFVAPGQDFTIAGNNFGVQSTTSTVQYAGHILPVIAWTNTSVRVYIPGSEPLGSGPVVVKTLNGTSNGMDIIVQNPDITPDQGPAPTGSNQETFRDNFQRCNGQPLGTHGCV